MSTPLSVSDSLRAIVPSTHTGTAQLGLEVEMFGFDAKTFAPLGTENAALSSQDLLRRAEALSPESHLKIDEPTGEIVGLDLGCGNFSLEPGGQLEYATCPKSDLGSVYADFKEGLRLLEEAARGQVLFLDHGTNPVAGPDLPLLVPKRRYRIMTRYFGSVPGGRGVHMMRYSATAQPNVDVLGDEAWLDAVNLSYVLNPMAAALFANSRYFFGKRVGPGSERQRIWQHVDPSRTGVPTGVVFTNDLTREYARWAREACVFMVGSLPDEEQPLYGELTFKQWEADGYKGTRPTEADWTTHLGTLFPDLRLRRFLEIRMIDAQSYEHALAPMAFWATALQQPQARERIWSLLDEVAHDVGLADAKALPLEHEAFARPTNLKKLIETVRACSVDERGTAALSAYARHLEERDGLDYPESGVDFVRERATARPTGLL